MSEGITMRKWWGHLKTITAHKARVMGLCFRVGLYRQGLLHDLSNHLPHRPIAAVHKHLYHLRQTSCIMNPGLTTHRFPVILYLNFRL